jgi:hypothetical protein
MFSQSFFVALQRPGFTNAWRNVIRRRRLISHHQPRKAAMLRIAAVTGALAVGLVSGAYAQATGPAAQTDTNKPGMTNSKTDSMKKSGTTGMSSGGESGMTNKGGANGDPATAPKTTTGPAGSASKSESPPK